MQQLFYLGGSGARQLGSRDVDTSSFQSIDQLKSSLGQTFNFANHASLEFFSKAGGKLDTLQDVRKHGEAVELRLDQSGSVREPPGPRGLPVFGNYYELYPDPVGNFDRLFARYGPVIKTVSMGTTIYQTNDPDISRFVLREGHIFTKNTSDPSHPLFYMTQQDALFTCDSDSPVFAKAHKFVPPALSPRAVAHHTPLIQDAARSIFPVLDHVADSDQAFHVYHYMFKLAGQVIWRVVVNQDLRHFDALDTKPARTIQVLGEWLHLMKKLSLRPQWYGKLPFGEPAHLRAAKNELWASVEKAVDECTTQGSATLPLSDPAASLQASCMADFLARARDDKGEGLARNLLISNVVILLGAGFTTSASLLSWCIYSLVQYPGNQERLLQELVDNGADGERKWTFDQVHALKFLDSFVKEVQRMHNPSFQTARNAREDTVLPGGYFVPKGSIVIPCFPSLHKNPRYWDNPLRFEPDRWAVDGIAAKMNRQGLYTPFAAGKRGCVGMNLALMEVKTVLVELVYRYHFENATEEPVVYDPEFLVTRPINFYATPTRRTVWPSPITKE
ncbi:cytochrome P450 [Cordyceps militaris]|uniref:Cytochrome P450 n=1 Tax=Cordyceps militaris TaxID=73501 RepID=A0A2H4SQG4_CORMI|nr:cytochrome P450 [Cordyceps militaris]